MEEEQWWKAKYAIEIKPAKGYYAIILANKNFGEHGGGACPVKNRDEAIKEIREIVRTWRNVTRKNLYFDSYTDQITVADVLGNTKLTDFIQG